MQQYPQILPVDTEIPAYLVFVALLEENLAQQSPIAFRKLFQNFSNFLLRFLSEEFAQRVRRGRRQFDRFVAIVQGTVTRIDPSVQNGTRTVDVSLNGDLPKGAVPDLSVDGTIELERLNDVLFMGRPAFGQEQSTVTLFKVDADGNASRVQV